jgi:hypothetical protein
MSLALGGLVALVISAGTASAIPDLGTPSSDPSFGTYCCGPASTNENNYNNGWHYATLSDSGVGFVELDLVNPTGFSAYFEYRADGEASQYGNIYAHPTVAGDYYYYYIEVTANSTLTQSFAANEYLEVRSAFGPERDYDFDWTRFDAQAVPAPAALPVLLIGFGAVGLMRRRQKA